MTQWPMANHPNGQGRGPAMFLGPSQAWDDHGSDFGKICIFKQSIPKGFALSVDEIQGWIEWVERLLELNSFFSSSFEAIILLKS